ncbi:vWA domain-containing protein [Deinococcus ruber]|uniref:VWA domain-containing protein n=1 Tax=Deinococcus ruber TaxID=1848197 RepID=A0A918CKZ5_9DEIO|nr:VWA domain-containing protein [Deinococcus ruber]GGR26424.1 VWA domain-containing protein [Deinococcus ruber]
METSAFGADSEHFGASHVYPARSLPENLCAFCDVLRQESGTHLGPGAVLDALRTLEYLGLSDLRRVKAGLRLVLCARQEDIGPFDRTFDAFFFPVGVAQPEQPGAEPPRPRRASDQDAPQGTEESPHPPPPQSAETQQEDFDGPGAQQSVADDDPDARAAEQPLYTRLSAQSGEDAPPAVRGSREMLAAAAAFLAQLRLGTSRRWRPDTQGTRFDMRRTLRASVSTGFEALTPRWQRRREPPGRVVLLLDGSRSMAGYNAPVLQFAAALVQHSRRADVFIFSTELRDVTAELRRASQLSAPADPSAFSLPALGHAWGGGTRIGECLETFLCEHARRVLRPNTLVIVASDGLDVGEAELLGRSVQTLARRSRGVVWLNPLTALEGYAPTARGMNAALPYLKTLTHASSPQEFATLAHYAQRR